MAASAGPAPLPVVLCVGTGNIGASLAAQLRARGDAEVLECSRSSADLALDLESPASLAALRERLPKGVDHVVVTAGASTFGPLESFDSAEKWERNLATKLGAVSSFALRLVHGEGCPGLLRDGGSITITTGQSAGTVNRMWPGLAANNAGLDMFVRCGGLGLPRGLRLNAVSPALVTETARRAGMPTEGTVPAGDVAAAFLPLIFGSGSGQVVAVGAQVKFQSDHTAGGQEADDSKTANGGFAPAERAAPKEGKKDKGAKVQAKPAASPEEEAKQKLKKVTKEGGKRGVEIEGAADMGGLQFFCTSVDEPEGDIELLKTCVEAMNTKSDPTEEERKGGSGHIGKMVFSCGVEQLALVAYVPEEKHGELSCKEWLEKVLAVWPSGKLVSEGASYCSGVIPTDTDKNIFPLKIREGLILEANNFLRGKGLFPEDNGDDSDEMVFGDDDFPS